MHTKGKLVIANDNPVAPDVCYLNVAIEGERRQEIAVCYSGSNPEQCAANARRIVACWNACEGIPTDALEAEDSPMIAASETLKQAEALLRELEEGYRLRCSARVFLSRSK